MQRETAKLRLSPRFVFVSTLVLAGVALAIFAYTLVGSRVDAAHKQLADARAQEQQLMDEILTHEAQLTHIQTDTYIESAARNLGLINDGEIRYDPVS